jgi:protein-S-isoprenylcysteine O-methyltransferase Ste14
MPLMEEFEAFGQWLFRWRSYLPLVTVALLLAALAGFDYPLGSHLLDQIWEVFCLGLSCLGLGARALTIGYAGTRTSGRNTVRQVAETLNTSGMYSIVRNPLYLGNFLMVLGVVMFYRVWWLPVIYTLLFALYYERIIFAEEMFLRRRFGAPYVEWASKTPAFLPRFRQWITPASRFDWKKLLRREYHGLMALVASMFALEITGDLYAGHGFDLDAFWAVLLSAGALSYGVLRFLHKHTKVLRRSDGETLRHGVRPDLGA